MNKKALFLALISLFAGLNLGTVRHTDDPIRDTQTNPILYEQKKEEEKDGVKGPLLYHVKNNPRESFFIDPPFEAVTKTPVKAAAEATLPASTGAAGWWEEQPTGSEATPLAKESVSSPSPESLPIEEPAKGFEDTKKHNETPEAATDNAKAPSGKGKGEDYWW